MTISIDWPTKVINVHKVDMTLIQSVPTVIYALNLNIFRLALRDLEDSEEGMPYEITHTHNPQVDVGGVSLARVIEIINGYTVTFEDDQYAVNLTDANSNVGDVVNVNQVSVRSGNSAGLITSDGIEAIEYAGRVTIDDDNGEVGSIYPIGTSRRPVNNLTDALIIASVRGFKTLYFLTDIVLAGGSDLDGFTIIGLSKTTTNITLDPTASCVNVSVMNCNITGTLDGNATIENCSVGDLDYVSGEIHSSGLYGTITLGGDEEAVINECYTTDQDNVPTIDMGGSGQDLAMPNYSGMVRVLNQTSDDVEIGIGLAAGMIILESTITAGTIVVAGVGLLQDNTTGTASVNSDGLLNKSDITTSIWSYVR